MSCDRLPLTIVFAYGGKSMSGWDIVLKKMTSHKSLRKIVRECLLDEVLY